MMEACAAAALIRKLTIERFRCVEHLVWHPEPGVNVILGGGDVGKTAVLDAVTMLLSPTNTGVLSDTDYWCRDVERGFCIEAVMSLPETCGISRQPKMAWPWVWDGSEPKLPKSDADPETADAERVYRVRARGTEDLELFFELLQPDETTEHFPVSVRRRIGLVRLGGDDRNDRDLRLVQGSALDRFISSKALRSRLSRFLSGSDIESELTDAERGQLAGLERAFAERALPTGLRLGVVTGHGTSPNALVGLTAAKGEVHLPVSSWGAGTRRLAALEIAGALQGECPITVVDELERGLEPYRQRVLMAALLRGGSQVFLTTHSAAALRSASGAALWHMDRKGAIGRLPIGVAGLHQRDPEAFLARITIIAEGATEVGFVSYLLERALDDNLLERGIWVADGRGHDSAVQLLEDLIDSGFEFAGFADDEGRCHTKWARVKDRLGNLLFRWPSGCLEENIISLVPKDRLEDFVRDPDGESGTRLRTLADRLRIEDKSFPAIERKAPDLKRLIIEAATGAIPETMEETSKEEKKELRKHGAKWFKSVEGGRELGAKVFEFNLWPQLEESLLPFINSVRSAVSLCEIAELPS
jgi:putative ATP-dependent endonuclease of OLD family